MRVTTGMLLFIIIFEAVLIAYLVDENHSLEKSVKELEIELKVYKTSNNRILEKNKELWGNTTKLEEENRELKLKIHELEQEKKKLKEEVEQLKMKVNSIKRTTEELKKVPKGYYSTDFFREHSNTADELKKFLKYEFKLPHSYEDDVFDCSEIAAYTEWALEDAGFDAYIAQGYYVNNAGAGGHAWVIVKIGNQQYYIDPTIMRKDDDRTILIPPEGYKVKPSAIFSDIYEAIKHDRSVEEWDWWNVVGFPPMKVT